MNAKVNLYLRVVRRRTDGYHEVETVLQSIGLADELRLAPAQELRLTCDDPALPVDERNLVWKAAVALRSRAGLPESKGATIEIRKRIPVGAGLGGGSADAAATLLGLERLWGVNLGRGALEELAATLGSDVPFFLTGGAAHATGRGERLDFVPYVPELWLVLVKPPFSVSTAWAYSAWKAETSEGASPFRFGYAYATRDPAAIAAMLRNDLEPGVAAAHPEIPALCARLKELGALGARMTGSGSAVFGIAAAEPEARRIAAAVGPALGEVGVVRTLAEGVPEVVARASLASTDAKINFMLRQEHGRAPGKRCS